MIRDVIKMISDIGTANKKIAIWGRALNLPQIVGGLFFITTIEGSTILAIEIITLIIASQIHKRSPFSRLVGLCHIPWLALLPFLIYRLFVTDNSIYFQVWMYYVAATMFVSIVFDVYDFIQYLKGNNKFNWSA